MTAFSLRKIRDALARHTRRCRAFQHLQIGKSAFVLMRGATAVANKH